MATVTAPVTVCPDCQGKKIYDNTKPGAKNSPKSPDYKCANCNAAFWLKDADKPKPAGHTNTVTRPHVQITVGELASKMSEAYDALQVEFGAEVLKTPLDTLYKMAFTELKGRAGD